MTRRTDTRTRLSAAVYDSGAVLDRSGTYRYTLWRCWDASGPRAGFILLNPSAADATRDDPTLRRCMAFAHAWGFGGVQVVNLFAFRTPNPDHLRTAADPIGPENDRYVLEASRRCALLVAGWGMCATADQRAKDVLSLLAEQEIYCLGYTKSGSPRHPLYMRGNVCPLPFRPLIAPRDSAPGHS
jgi:hypothetical protein